MPLSPDALKEVDAQVRGGFENRERIIEIFCEELYAPGELDSAEVEAAVDKAMADHEAAKRNWPEVIDCDRLDKAFDAINKRGIIGLQDAELAGVGPEHTIDCRGFPQVGAPERGVRAVSCPAKAAVARGWDAWR